MTLDEVLAYIHKVDWRGSVPGLSRIDTLLGLLGHPERHVKYVHVTGTNGKGSTCAMLASVLRAAGYKTGLYTSPYIFRFNERMQINGAPIPDDTLCALVEELRPLADRMADPPTEFELVTAIGLTWFAREACDIVVCEVGMGGEFDATNVIPAPEVAVLTNIGLDHTSVLGNTVEAIAATKAGIIKPHVPVVVGEAVAETRPVFEAKARECGSPIFFAEDRPEVLSAHDTPEGREYQTRSFGTLLGDLRGDYQTRNANTILASVSQLLSQGTIRHPESIGEGFRSVCRRTGLMGRWQPLPGHPHAVCDTGHNVAGWQMLAPQIMAQPARNRRLVFGMVDDKDLTHVMELLPREATYYWTQPSTHRAFPAEKVAECGRAHGLHGTLHPSVAEAYRAALAEAAPDDFIFVGGSSYVVADLLASLQEKA